MKRFVDHHCCTSLRFFCVKDFPLKNFAFPTRVTPALVTLAVRENVAIQGLPGLLALQDPQQRWSDSETALLCSRSLDLLDRQGHQGLMEL